MAADINHRICQTYGVEHPEAGVAFRAAFVIDKNGVVRSQLVNDLPIGRNIDEIIRVIDAVQYNEAHGEVCPAGWKKGDIAMKATTDGVASYLANNESAL
jgi:peroxiredoxin (alkyl hydroperoxide reductase subunit C)